MTIPFSVLPQLSFPKLLRFRKAGFATLLLLFITGCSSTSSKDDKPAPLVKFTHTLTIKTVWTTDLGGNLKKNPFKLAPVFEAGKIFVATPKGQVAALNVTDGKLLWQRKLDVTIAGGPGVGENVVFVGSQKGEVIALSEENGNELWRQKVSSEVLVAPQVQEGIVVIRTGDGKLFGLDKNTGNRLWVYERTIPLLTLRGSSVPFLLSDRIIAGFDNGKLAALNLRTGELLWEKTVAEPHGRTELERMVDIDAPPLVMDNLVFVTSYQGRTMAREIDRGEEVWSQEVSSHAGLGIDSENVYVSDSQSHIWALKRESGVPLWKQEKLQFRQVTAPVPMGNYVVVGDLEGYLHWLRRDDGQFVARHSTGNDSLLVPPLVVNNLLVAYTSGGELVGLKVE